MKKWKAFVLAAGLFVGMVTPVPAQAITVFGQCTANPDSKVCKASGDANEQNATTIVKRIIDLLLFALGITAVFMIIWSGVKYVTSRGDAANVKSAKDTLTYAVVGLIVALLAYAIVNFIINSFK
jgi:hypothetical protein